MPATRPSLAAWAAMLLLPLLAGCTHFSLKPDEPSILPQSAFQPLPLTVGIAIDQPGFAARFANVLKKSGLFQGVRYPSPAQPGAGVDLVVSGKGDWTVDPDRMAGAKILLTGFTGFFTGALIHETSHYIAHAVVSVTGPGGRTLATYEDKADVEGRCMVSPMAEARVKAKGPTVAEDNLAVQLVQKLVDDRKRFAGLSLDVADQTQERAAPAATGSGKTWWQRPAK